MQNGSASLDHLQPDDDDLLYEEELLRNPYSLKMWWRYLEARRDAPAQKRYILYERALKALPVSYKVCRSPSGLCSGLSPRAPETGLSNCQQKLRCRSTLQLWHSYLRERQKAVRGLSVADRTVEALNNTYQRALVSMHKMPRIWLEYLVRPVPFGPQGTCQQQRKTRKLWRYKSELYTSARGAPHTQGHVLNAGVSSQSRSGDKNEEGV